MPLDMPVEDLRRDLVGCVVIHKNKPVFVNSVSHDGEVFYTDLITQKEGVALFTLKAFTSPTRRLGYVNVMGSVLYLTRLPVRKFFLGLNTKNITIKHSPDLTYPQGRDATISRVKGLCCAELGDAMFNRYPSFAECVEHVMKFGGAKAFDKQFAVGSNSGIYYKGELVGTLKSKKAKGFGDIKWYDGKQYLSILLEGNYEKAVRDFRPSSI